MIGVFGGAFDPPHVGHVALAAAGIEHFALDRLLVRVVEQPGHKDVGDRAADPARPGGARVRAVRRGRGLARPVRPHRRLARGARPRRPGLPRRGRRVRCVPRVEGARARARARPARRRDAAGRRPRAGWTPCSRRSSAPSASRSSRSSRFGVSSSDIRARAAAGEPIDGLVPPAVAAEIDRSGALSPRLTVHRPGVCFGARVLVLNRHKR